MENMEFIMKQKQKDVTKLSRIPIKKKKKSWDSIGFEVVTFLFLFPLITIKVN